MNLEGKKIYSHPDVKIIKILFCKVLSMFYNVTCQHLFGKINIFFIILLSITC